MRLGLCLSFLLACFPACICLAQPKAQLRPPPGLSQAEGEKQARALVADLLAQKPPDSTNTGVLKIKARNSEAKERPVEIEIASTLTNCTTSYEVRDYDGGETRLVVVHTEGQPNRYLLTEPMRPPNTNTLARELTPSQLMVPFAGSDFWIADLGLEFLHWPQQRVLRKELRLSQSCDVLESVNPRPEPGGYARVVSWIDMNNGGIVHADAYDAHGDLVKQFAPTELKTINGQKQVEEIEMRNKQTGSRTWIKFNLKQK